VGRNGIEVGSPIETDLVLVDECLGSRLSLVAIDFEPRIQAQKLFVRVQVPSHLFVDKFPSPFQNDSYSCPSSDLQTNSPVH
jgi:hypothetical protein